MLLLRHASAGGRLSVPELDRARGLDRAGRAQAARLPDALTGYRVEAVVTSPYLRCVETVAPLACAFGLDLAVRRELEPGASKRATRRLLRELPPAALVCSHREVFETLFDGEIECEKGGAWFVEKRGRAFVATAYRPPAPAAGRRRSRTALV